MFHPTKSDWRADESDRTLAWRHDAAKRAVDRAHWGFGSIDDARRELERVEDEIRARMAPWGW